MSIHHVLIDAKMYSLEDADHIVTKLLRFIPIRVDLIEDNYVYKIIPDSYTNEQDLIRKTLFEQDALITGVKFLISMDKHIIT